MSGRGGLSGLFWATGRNTAVHCSAQFCPWYPVVRRTQTPDLQPTKAQLHPGTNRREPIRRASVYFSAAKLAAESDRREDVCGTRFGYLVS
jgi:hypothetical protein